MPDESHRDDGPNDDRDALADELLAVRCLLGEPAAFDALVARWHEPLRLYLGRLIGDEDAAADTLQDCWLRVLRALPGLRDPARLRPWLFGIARRAAMDRFRRRHADAIDELADVSEVAAPDAPDDDPELLARMHEALGRLPIMERDVLVLFYLQELSLAQLADVLQVPTGTVKSRLHRARRLLRRALTDGESGS